MDDETRRYLEEMATGYEHNRDWLLAEHQRYARRAAALRAALVVVVTTTGSYPEADCAVDPVVPLKD